MKHRFAVLGAIAIGLMVSLLLVGRVRAADPPWTPGPGATWQIQFEGAVDTSVDADVFELDAVAVRPGTIRTLQDMGHHVICYLDAGSWEPYRPDSRRFPASVLGRRVAGWPDERWLDVRQIDVLRPIMRNRLDRCVAKGFDGVDFDWIDGYSHATGFPLTRAHQLRYDRFLAAAAHRRGLAVALKNGLPLVPDLARTYDFAVNEQCFQYHECGRLQPFLDAGKAVFTVEYERSPDDFCPRAVEMGISAIRKHLALDAWRIAC